MAAWTEEELSKIAAADELQLASLRSDGSLRKPVTIWVARYGDALYVRSVRGRAGAWFRGVQDRHEARIHAGGVEKDVALDETSDLLEQIDAAYRAKYHRYAKSIVDSVLTPQARRHAQAHTARLKTRTAPVCGETPIACRNVRKIALPQPNAD